MRSLFPRALTYHLTITEAAALRRQLETAIRQTIIDHHPPTPQPVLAELAQKPRGHARPLVGTPAHPILADQDQTNIAAARRQGAAHSAVIARRQEHGHALKVEADTGNERAEPSPGPGYRRGLEQLDSIDHVVGAGEP